MQSYNSHPRGTVFYYFINFFYKHLALLICYEKYRELYFLCFPFYGKYDISVSCRKTRTYDIYVERFYENVDFHAVCASWIFSLFFYVVGNNEDEIIPES